MSLLLTVNILLHHHKHIGSIGTAKHVNRSQLWPVRKMLTIISMCFQFNSISKWWYVYTLYILHCKFLLTAQNDGSWMSCCHVVIVIFWAKNLIQELSPTPTPFLLKFYNMWIPNSFTCWFFLLCTHYMEMTRNMKFASDILQY